VAFINFPELEVQQPGNQLPEDLSGVFLSARRAQSQFSGAVNAWEMVGEPDLGFCTDLPDRVAAYQKAAYLGLKAERRAALRGYPGLKLRGKPRDVAPVVLMGALGMPPGPWLDRFIANGGLNYTDAYNFHFYGHSQDLSGVIAAHRVAASLVARESETRNQKTDRESPPLPLWITECGIEAVDRQDFLNPKRRRLQAEFTIATAKQALASEDVAMFMPFILVHDNDPYAMILSPGRTFPAWDAYARFTRENQWPQRPLAREAIEVSPVVVQWLPDNSTCVPRKVSGTYRFREGQPIKGEFRIYNFSEKVREGKLELSDLKAGRFSLGASNSSEAGSPGMTRPTTVKVPAMGMVRIPVEFVRTTKGYFRETVSGKFIEAPSAALGDAGTPLESRVSFGLEAWAKIDDFVESPLVLGPLPEGKIQSPQMEPYEAGDQVGVWTTINGVRGEARSSEGGRRKAEAEVSQASFWVEKESTDPLFPAMAVASIKGLPAFGFIRLLLDKPMTKDRKVLVVLVDDRGQRYTIWENFGADYYGSRSDIWLNLEDFHADFWGRMSADYQFRPERIREVHLRLYLETPMDKVGVKLTLLRAKTP
jgi:hypothetical protein